ncbi:MAG: hypothetical protein V2A58_03995 [Planctomycetota bacterium]
MRRAFVMMEVLLALAAIAVVAGGAIVLFVKLTEETVANRIHAVAVHEMRNTLAELEDDPASAPGVGEERERELSPAVRERYPNLRIVVRGEREEVYKGLTRVRITATERRAQGPRRSTSVEALLRAKEERGGGR